MAQRSDNPSPNALAARAEMDTLRIKVFAAYGGKCACCGDTEKLQVDHIIPQRGDGKGGRTRALYRRIVKLGFPSEFQLLCRWCNHSKGVQRYCEHQWIRLLAEARRVNVA